MKRLAGVHRSSLGPYSIAPMARSSGRHTIQCYHCRVRFEVGRRARSTSCPGCYKPIIVEDIVVKKLKPVQKVQTCGKVIVRRSGRILAERIEAHAGIKCLGAINATSILTGGHVFIGPNASWKGDLHSPSVEIKGGAQIARCYFTVPDDPLELADLTHESTVRHATNG